MSRPVRACLLVGLVTTSVIAGVLLSELILRLAGYTTQVKIPDRHILIPQFYFKADPLNGYDIADNFFDAPFNFSDYIRIHGAPFMISSNNLGCRDQSFDQEGDYVLLIGDSFTWGYAPLEQTWGQYSSSSSV
ncbi:MAG: hypothetical protein KF693_08540 [Nitrospira sp.]|nr:hypothetical protein [Nitrospira sp.]